MESRITDLEIRLTHQEAALEELTLNMLRQQKTIETMGRELEQIKRLLRDLAPSQIAPLSEETPPPHY